MLPDAPTQYHGMDWAFWITVAMTVDHDGGRSGKPSAASRFGVYKPLKVDKPPPGARGCVHLRPRQRDRAGRLVALAAHQIGYDER